jgi:hypothetical protein
MIKGTTRICGYDFEDEDVVVDFTTYEQCHFKKCRIIYYGQFAGPAANAINYLHALYTGDNEGGRELVENTFQMIRQSDPPVQK